MNWVVPPHSNSGNEGLGWDSLLKMFHNPGGDCWMGGTTQPGPMVCQTPKAEDANWQISP